LRFFNLRAQYYQHLADLLERDALDGLRDAAAIGQLAVIRYELDASGRIKIESKESARQRGVRSPDRADALMLALGNHRPEIIMKDLLILPRRAERGAYIGGFGEDNGVDNPKPLRYERADPPGLWKW
jgi:phage terminase large subunit